MEKVEVKFTVTKAGFAEGEVYLFSPSLARELVASGKAEYVSNPEVEETKQTVKPKKAKKDEQ